MGPRASRQKQRLQQVFFPDGIRFDGRKLVGTGTTLPAFNYLNPVSEQKKDLVDQTGGSWNHITSWLRRVEALREAA